MMQETQNINEILNAIREEFQPQTDACIRQIDRSMNCFPIPIRINNHDEYDDKITDELFRYLQFIRNTPALLHTPNLLSSVEDVVNHILSALKAERIGDTEEARKSIKFILEKYKDDKFFVSELDRNYAFRGSAAVDDFQYSDYDYSVQKTFPLSFFRCRNSQETDFKKMLHIPLNMRSQIGTNRFSLPGIPCLYLASTTFCCWQELNQPEKMSAAAFKVNDRGKKLKILNLVVSQRLIDGADNNPYEPMPPLAQSMRTIFPLVLATSVSVSEQQKCKYAPEYTISHLIMRCLKELGIDGVAYLSTQIDDEYQFPHGVNLAIPVFEDAQQMYGDICGCFEVTNPIFFSCNAERSNSKCAQSSSYVNEAFPTGFNSTIICSGKRKPYKETIFAEIDDSLASATHYCLSEINSVD